MEELLPPVLFGGWLCNGTEWSGPNRASLASSGPAKGRELAGFDATRDAWPAGDGIDAKNGMYG